ncbi:sucrase ferredoxin [Kribbella soli]|uniref:Sucrase ferredoxin n=1 Tax=Kribbella soli TaxID=1124743 RepID=A0A4R0HMG4_9ACTN|nr:sucrase ferredoxin [Kribbella soli]TCC11961.1 sucrase ferredoxin [Kribbella soli]
MDSGDVRYRPETGCAALADLRHDSLTATAPPAERWLLIESRSAWPRQALTSLRNSSSGAELGDVVARRCRELRIRPVLIRRYGRVDLTVPRRWGLVDCRPGRELVRWGALPTDEHLLEVLAGKDSGLVSNEPVYLVCAHGRHDACCAVRGRPVAAALAAAYPGRTWECSHIGGDRFAANVVVLPHGLFYGHVTPARAVELAKQYDEGAVVPDLLRGSGAFVPPVQAAQHFARAAGHSPALGNLLPQTVEVLGEHRWRILLASANGLITVEVSARLDTVDARLTCAGSSPAQIRRFELHSLTTA